MCVLKQRLKHTAALAHIGSVCYSGLAMAKQPDLEQLFEGKLKKVEEDDLPFKCYALPRWFPSRFFSSSHQNHCKALALPAPSVLAAAPPCALATTAPAVALPAFPPLAAYTPLLADHAAAALAAKADKRMRHQKDSLVE